MPNVYGRVLTVSTKLQNVYNKNLRNLLINNNIILAQTPEIGPGLGRFLSCGARKPEQT